MQQNNKNRTDDNALNAAIDVLNEALYLDAKAINSLFNTKVDCNKSLADHETIIVGGCDCSSTAYHISILGILNGILGKIGNSKIASVKEINNSGPDKIIKFTKYNDEG